MVSEREAKVWMVAALAVFVWACVMVGCSSTGYSTATPTATPQPAANPTEQTSNTPEMAWLTPMAQDYDASLITVASEPAIETWNTPAKSEAFAPESSLMMAELAPAQPDLLRRHPREVPDNLDLGLSSLSLAHPVLSAKRLLVAGVTTLDRLPKPVIDEAAFQVDRAAIDTRPIAAAVFADQLVAADAPRMDVPVEFAGLVLEQPAWLIQGDTTPTPPSPLPAPTIGAAMTADEAKFDSAGVIGMVLGAMVLLFGGEAIVLLLLNRNQAAAKAKLHDALANDGTQAHDDEPSIFRLPEPIAEEPTKVSHSRAA